MTKDEMIARLTAADGWVPDKRIKIDFGDQGIVFLDGVAKAITAEDDAADTTIHIAWDDWIALGKGQLNPMTAFMSGRIKVDGELGGAMALQGVMSKLTG